MVAEFVVVNALGRLPIPFCGIIAGSNQIVQGLKDLLLFVSHGSGFLN